MMAKLHREHESLGPFPYAVGDAVSFATPSGIAAGVIVGVDTTSADATPDYPLFAVEPERPSSPGQRVLLHGPALRAEPARGGVATKPPPPAAPRSKTDVGRRTYTAMAHHKAHHDRDEA
jgi:hypothetical protein